MSRVERKKEKKSKKKNTKKLSVSIITLIILAGSGIWTVDEAFRERMLIEESMLFRWEKVDTKTHEVWFCGEMFYIDEQKIQDAYTYVKDGVMDMAEEVKVIYEEHKN